MPDDPLDAYLAQLDRDVEELLAKAEQKKRLANQVCADSGRPPRYADTGEVFVGSSVTASLGSIRRDHFHGRKMATAIREYLQMRGASDRGGLGAASVNEIYAALIEGGFTFDTKNDLNAKRGLRDALMKNSVTFHRVGDAYGLIEWYPKPPRTDKPVKKRRKGKKTADRKSSVRDTKGTTADNVVDLKSETQKQPGASHEPRPAESGGAV
jgi:hypothetical protein